MTLEEYFRQQALSRSVFLRVIAGLLQLLPAAPTPQEWTAFIEALYPSVYRGRMDAYRIAERFYRQERQDQLGVDDPIDIPRRNYSPEDLTRALRVVRGKLSALRRGGLVPPVIGEEARATLTNQVLAGSRHAIRDAARHDDKALGYARVATGAETCAFCLMLVSRGPVYKSRNKALLRDGGGEPYHPSCDCEVVPVFHRENWTGRDQYLEASRLWQEHRNLAKLRQYLDTTSTPLPADLRVA